MLFHDRNLGFESKFRQAPGLLGKSLFILSPSSHPIKRGLFVPMASQYWDSMSDSQSPWQARFLSTFLSLNQAPVTSSLSQSSKSHFIPNLHWERNILKTNKSAILEIVATILKSGSATGLSHMLMWHLRSIPNPSLINLLCTSFKPTELERKHLFALLLRNHNHLHSKKSLVYFSWNPIYL